METTHYIVKARNGQNYGQATAEGLARFLEDWAPTFDGRTSKGKDIRKAAQLVRRAEAIINKHDGFK